MVNGGLGIVWAGGVLVGSDNHLVWQDVRARHILTESLRKGLSHTELCALMVAHMGLMSFF